ncbi:cell division protease FtsH [Lentzea californiensis]|uniref:ATP-dependent zinc metalloprotease FtsH n=2 Tax=Pseudonocardiaceae TaxID=2070 RepID=A0A1H9X3T2_9PSEU|nr:cell division protease FtsH [Lentzea californiensis]RDI20884.1 membrane protease FtsH catalytic subunit [Lentzea flaviverrucosa]SES40785.1 cell division protease FtsH [Lentzea flaviverrucosa]
MWVFHCPTRKSGRVEAAPGRKCMDRKRLLRNPLLWIAAVLLLYFVFTVLFDDSRGYHPVKTSQALQQVRDGKVKEATIEDKEQRLRLTLTDGTTFEGSNRLITQFPASSTDEIFTVLDQAGNKPTVETKVSQESILMQILIYLVPLGLLLLLLMWMMNNAQGGGNRVLNFGKSKAKQLSKDMPKTTFADVAGAQEAVEELEEIKDFLQNPGRYQALGAKIPKGVLLYGPPGTGKTLLARAVAGEAGVPFYSISGSDFVEMFVGVGASRVRDLFEQAKQNAPCIIFVDEIDAVGRHRGAGMGGGHDEREQTLNQLLVEMDGFDSRGGIILIAATNRPDILDPALLRPGRFDRQIPVSVPDLKGRKQILRVHSKGKPLAADADLDGLAKRTVGFSGADLANVINEAALLTARQNGHTIDGAALEESVDRVIGGPARKSRIISEKEKKITAYHEAGHALAAWAMPDIDPVYKVTILARGRTGGHTLSVPEEDKDLMTRSEMIARLVFALGGRSAEELVFHEPTTGASNDIEQATKIARAMVTEYGMSAKLGAVKYGQEQGEPFLGRSAGRQADYSLEVAHEIDEEVRKLIEAAHTEAYEVLVTYRDVLDDLTLELIEKETLHQKELERIFARVEKRPRITQFNDFGDRRPSDIPPIKTPGELARERGEPWPPIVEDTLDDEPETQQAEPAAAEPATEALPSPNGSNGVHQPGQPSNQAGPPNYGAPPGWTPATVPGGKPHNVWEPKKPQPDQDERQ